MDGNRRRKVVIKRVMTIQNKRVVSTTQDYSELRASLLSLVETIRTDRSVALKLLAGTGMYTEDGQLKEEFK